MTFPVTTTIDQILDGMLAQIAPLTPGAGNVVTPAKPVYFADRYMGQLKAGPDGMRRGIAGRCPCVLVAWERERPVTTTVGRKRDKVEASLLAIVCSDSVRSKDDRAQIFQVIDSVIKLIGARSYGLDIQPLRYAGIADVIEQETLYASGARFTTRYHRDYTVDITTTLNSVSGFICLPLDQDPLRTPIVSVAETFTQ